MCGVTPITHCVNVTLRFSSAQYDTLDITLLVSSVCGILGAGVMVLTMGLVEPTFTSEGTLYMAAVFWLSMGDLVLAVAYLIDSLLDPRDAVPGLVSVILSGRPWSLPAMLDGGCNSSSTNCKVIGAVNQYSSGFSLVWMFVIAVGLFTSLRETPVNWQSTRGWTIVTHVVAWLLPALPVAVVGAIGGFGYAGNNCWIRDGSHFEWTWFAFYYGPEAAVTIFATSVYVRASLRTSHTLSTLSLAEDSRLSIMRGTINRRLTRLTLVYIVFQSVKLTNRLYVFGRADNSASLGLLVLTNAVSPLKGLINAFVYGGSRHLRQRARVACSRLASRTRMFISLKYAAPSLRSQGSSVGNSNSNTSVVSEKTDCIDKLVLRMQRSRQTNQMQLSGDI